MLQPHIKLQPILSNQEHKTTWRIGGVQPTLPEGAATKPECVTPALLPVDIVGQTAERTLSPTIPAAASSENLCEIEFERARVRIRGDVSADMLRLLIRELSR